jgi:hypothetical protein
VGEVQVVRLGQVQHGQDAEQIHEGIRQEIGIDRASRPGLRVKPVPADRFVQALVEQGEAADQADRGGDQQREAHLPAVPRQVDRQRLAQERVMDRLVAALDLVPLQVDEHVGEASHCPHEQRGQTTNDPQNLQEATDRPAQDEKAQDDGQEQRPRRPREQSLPEQEAPVDARPDHETEGPKEPAQHSDLEQDAGRQRQCRKRDQEQVR